MKIFQHNIFKGTLIESYTSKVATIANASFEEGVKGTELRFESTGITTLASTLSGVKTIAFVINPTTNTELFKDSATLKLQITGGNISGTGLTQCYINTGSGEVDTDTVSLNKYQLVIAEFSAGISFATDIRIDVTSVCRIAGKVWMFNELLDATKRNELYNEFQNSDAYWFLEKQTIGFDYPKPTELKEDGLVAAYNFDSNTVNNGVMTDISGNGNDGTISGALLTKDGMSTSSTRYIALPSTSSLIFTGDFTVTFRISNNNVIFGRNAPSYDYIRWQTASNKLIKINNNLITFNDFLVSDGNTITITRSGTTVSGYLNGNYVGGGSSSKTFNISSGYIGFDGQYGGGEYVDLRFYNYAFTPAQAQSYYNSFIKPILIEDFSNYPVTI